MTKPVFWWIVRKDLKVIVPVYKVRTERHGRIKILIRKPLYEHAVDRGNSLNWDIYTCLFPPGDIYLFRGSI